MRNTLIPLGTAVAMAAAVFTAIVAVGTDAAPSPARQHVVHIKKFKFDPPVINVAPGDTITWINDDLVPHTVTADDKSWNSGRLNSKARWTLVVEPGTFGTYFCRFHPAMKAGLSLK